VLINIRYETEEAKGGKLDRILRFIGFKRDEGTI
jgi:hypothetical protein